MSDDLDLWERELAEPDPLVDSSSSWVDRTFPPEPPRVLPSPPVFRPGALLLVALLGLASWAALVAAGVAVARLIRHLV